MVFVLGAYASTQSKIAPTVARLDWLVGGPLLAEQTDWIAIATVAVAPSITTALATLDILIQQRQGTPASHALVVLLLSIEGRQHTAHLRTSLGEERLCPAAVDPPNLHGQILKEDGAI